MLRVLPVPPLDAHPWVDKGCGLRRIVLSVIWQAQQHPGGLACPAAVVRAVVVVHLIDSLKRHDVVVK